MIIRIADHGHCCHRCKCTNETQLGKHYIFYPVGTTKEYDSGLYIPVVLAMIFYWKRIKLLICMHNKEDIK